MLVDRDGKIIFVNSHTERMFGYQHGDLEGRMAEALVASGSRSRRAFQLDAASDKGRAFGGQDLDAQRADGSQFPVEISLSPIATSDGTFVYAAIRDISERRRAEAEIERLRHQQELLLTSVTEGVLGLDEKGQITFVNPAASRLLGYRQADLLGKSEHDLFHMKRADGTSYPENFCPIHRSFQDGTIHHAVGEVFWNRAGQSFPVEYTSAPIRENGKLVGASLIFIDVSDRSKTVELERNARESNIARPLARKIVQDLVEQGSVAHPILTQVGRKLAGETNAKTLIEHLAAYREMGLGSLEVEKAEGGRYTFSGSDLLERRPESRVATCSFTLGYLSEAVAHLHTGESTLGTEIECQSRGAVRCRFIVQVKKAEEGLARRVKELI